MLHVLFCDAHWMQFHPYPVWSAVAQLVGLDWGLKGWSLQDSALAESMYCVLEQDTLSAA